MASNADQHAAANGGGGTTPAATGSPPAGKKAAAAAAWKRPGNGAAVPVVVAPGSPIMDADSWPALPGLASPPPTTLTPTPMPPKASPKVAPLPPPAEAVIPPISLGNSGAPDANPDHEAPVRNPPARRALVMPVGDGLDKRAPGSEPSPVYTPNARSNGGGDHHQNGRYGSHPHSRGSGYGGGGNRRGNGGGGGGGRRGQEHHGGFDGQRRGGGRRDGHGPGHQQRGHHPSYIRAPLAVVTAAPPPPPPFVNPATPQTPPYGAPIGFPAEIAPHVYYFTSPLEGVQALPFVPHPASPPAMLIPQFDPLRAELLKQIEYYFSDDNLCKDIFLRRHMDDQGWVPLPLIAGFNQVKKLTNNVQFILETVLQSTVVEVQGDKLRKRERWEIWLLPKQGYSAGNSSGSLSPVTSNIDSLASQFQSVGLEGAGYHASQGMPGEALLTRSATSVSLGYQAPPLGGLYSNGSGPLFGQKSARSLLRSDTF
ncbi:la-related protein 1C isoform X1 [Oryza sativa Japonica Group]|uniref:la-related protein 1C isoform X1 n=1 Tax=Oryza sativa subsp. japonica TaxID=39947 RepID=UPI000775524D|nr:la-related protein 1C isoform X1 [Oryza sativa Japonica Group]